MTWKFIIFFMIGAMRVLPIFAMDQDSRGSPAPYYLVRSLQNAFDDAVNGRCCPQKKNSDVLEETSTQLRSTNMDAFADRRNVDAILIYTIISGDSSILKDVVLKDTKGYFDDPIVHALGKYFEGETIPSIRYLNRIKESSRARRLEPYIYFIIGNTMRELNSKGVLRFFDHVRLTSPGTALEEISLRNLIKITSEKGMEGRALEYIRDYARYFHHSIYKDNFVDLSLNFFLSDWIKVSNDDIISIISFLDLDDQYRMYLKIARHAAIAGKKTIGILAIEQLNKMKSTLDNTDLASIWLYKDLINMPFVDAFSSQRSLYNIADDFLRLQDRNLKKAAKTLLEDILKRALDDKTKFVDRDLTFKRKQKDYIDLNLATFIERARKKIKIIDVFLEEYDRS
ncbi:chemotaxis protein [Candidatus Liberibacter sp.]|uniref:chemotaxis protein n=1 Tax=Candidatus Liberibacter sp. TaxID=34022 RepID=UPI0015F5E4C5|nr:chemotaxis protein [Candidatus Liberibacter sp.]MBA5724080.1 chemotaxis protein [Candidatus Liberibacter sp.]